MGASDVSLEGRTSATGRLRRARYALARMRLRLVLHVELVEVCCCSGWEYEAVCGAVDEADAVQGADGVGYFHRSADFAGQFLGGPGTLVVVDE